MYYYMDMPFDSEATALSTFGSIKMYYKNYKERLGTTQYGGSIRVRYYVLLSEDISKLSNITNAADGSRAIVTDTSKTYVLCSGQWREWTGANDLSELKWELI